MTTKNFQLAVLLAALSFTAACDDDIVKWMHGQGMLAVSVPAATWQPGTLVIWTSGSDGRVNVQRVCSKERLDAPAASCAASSSYSVSDASNFNATLSAEATQMFKASPGLSTVKSVTATMKNVQLCDLSQDVLSLQKMKTECAEAAQNAIAFSVRTHDKSKTFVTWINQAIVADVDFDVESDVDFGVTAQAEVKNIVNGANKSGDVSTGVQALLPDVNIDVKYVDKRHLAVSGKGLVWGIHGLDLTLQQIIGSSVTGSNG